MARTNIQLIFDVRSFYKKMSVTHGNMSAGTLAELYENMGKPASGADKITTWFIDSSMTIWDRILQHDGPRATILALENEFGRRSPFDSLTKLQKLCDRAKRPDAITFLVDGIADAAFHGLYSPNEFTGTFLYGKPNGEKGYYDVLNLRLDILEHLAYVFAPKHNFSDAALKHLTSLVRGPSAYRAMFGGSKPGFEVDLSWMGTMKASEQALLRLAENLCFKHDMTLITNMKTWLRAKKSVVEIMTESTVQTMVNEVLELHLGLTSLVGLVLQTSLN